MNKFYAQVDEHCGVCGEELPKGSEFWIRGDDEIFCPKCGEEALNGKWS